jgi:hypothetical protein
MRRRMICPGRRRERENALLLLVLAVQSSFAMRRGLSRPLELGRLPITVPDYPKTPLHQHLRPLLRRRNHKTKTLTRPLCLLYQLNLREKESVEYVQAINVLDSRLAPYPGPPQPEAETCHAPCAKRHQCLRPPCL